MSKVSVVVPAYNAERTILETIASVQQQTFSDLEIIVINDGSTDRTLDLLGTVEDSRFKIFSYPNGGLPVARNRGISHATGEFITFIDADDLWTPDKLELQLLALEQYPEAGVAYSWTSCVDEQVESFHVGVNASFEGDVYVNLLVNNFIASGSNVLLKRQAIEAVGGFDPCLKSCEDWDYWLRLAPHWHFVVVPKPQILYRLSSGSMSSKIEVMEKYQLLVLERAFQAAPPKLQFLKNQAISNIYQYLAQLCLTRISGAKGIQQASQKLWTAIRMHPQTLFSKKTQTLLLKLLLIRVLSPEIASHLLQVISKIRATRDPRLQQN